MKIQNLLIVCLLVTCIACRTTRQGEIEMTTLAKSTRSWNGAALPDYPTGQPEITILKATIPPGSGLMMHKHPVINAGVLIKGELTVISERSDTLHLKAGDPIIELVDTWHFGRNEGRKPAEIIVFYAGERDAPITVTRTQRE